MKNQLSVLFFVGLLAVFSPVRTHASDAKRVHKMRFKASSCSAVKPLFVAKNISDPPDHSIEGPLFSRLCPVVNGTSNCCTSRMENQLKSLARKELQEVLRQNSHSIQEVLHSNSRDYLEKIIELSRRSENRTLETFAQVFQRLAPEARVPIQQLFSKLRQVLADPGPASFLNDSSADLEEVSLHDTITNFFHQLFPLVYRHSIIHTNAEITSEYSLCLQHSIHKLRPFGDIPKSVGFAIGKAVRAIHDFLRSLSLGLDALVLAEHAWDKSDECSSALLRMSYCSRCSGYAEVKPCAGYCQNVMRGCLAHLTELDASWNGYVDSLEEHVASAYALNGLVKAEKAVGALETQISDAIMQAMVDGPSLEKRVKSACGPVQLQDTPKHQKSPKTAPSKASKLSLKKDNKYELETQLSNLARQVLVSLIRSKGFFSSLSDSICADDSFAETDTHAECWNGQRISQYTKTVVSAGLGAQKYNPELPWNGKPTDLRIIQMSDRLRQVRRALLGQSSALPDADNQVLEDGSGSGGIEPNPGGGPDDEDNWDGSGSGGGGVRGTGGGDGPIRRKPGTVSHSPTGGRDAGSKETSSSTQHRISTALWAISLSVALLFKLAPHLA
ncbi:division abnormally delayed protein [Neocloeon triangulifer]|uniref:division abnormally delayed protein n=1 Tax=Neocloeon triangulifer TaxID=2078957 RepID=UPI00286F0C78|nr:division abnormally delayed protein [Neocloeon triangulifer]